MFDLSYTSKPQGRVQGRGLMPTPLKQLMAKEGADADAALTYAVESMGCAMNTADSERMAGQLMALGFKEASTPQEVTKADVVVVNTCSIRDHAEQKVYSYLGPYINRKKRGDNLAIVVAGCPSAGKAAGIATPSSPTPPPSPFQPTEAQTEEGSKLNNLGTCTFTHPTAEGSLV
ncbi:hypothetical protein VYU27_007193 [Nannochloropsis oceanica]